MLRDFGLFPGLDLRNFLGCHDGRAVAVVFLGFGSRGWLSLIVDVFLVGSGGDFLLDFGFHRVII